MNLSDNLITRKEQVTKEINIKDENVEASLSFLNGKFNILQVTNGHRSYLKLDLEEVYQLRNVIDMIMIELEGY